MNFTQLADINLIYSIFSVHLITSIMSIPSQIKYQPVDSVNNRYRHLRIPMTNIPAGLFQITAATSQLCEWKLPSNVYSLAQSYIGYQIVAPAQGVSDYAWFNEDTFDLASTAYFGNASGLT